MFIFGGFLGNGRYDDNLYEFNNGTFKNYTISHSKSISGQGMSGVITKKGDIYIFGGHKGSLLLGMSDSSSELFILKKLIFEVPLKMRDIRFIFK